VLLLDGSSSGVRAQCLGPDRSRYDELVDQRRRQLRFVQPRSAHAPRPDSRFCLRLSSRGPTAALGLVLSDDLGVGLARRTRVVLALWAGWQLDRIRQHVLVLDGVEDV
jgi:hypothetical protein